MRRLVLLSLLFLSACSADSPFAVRPIWTKIHGDQLTKDFSPDARQGWKDGCETGYTVYGSNVYKSTYGFKRDTTKVGNYQYENEWYNGYNYCRQNANMMMNESTILD